MYQIEIRSRVDPSSSGGEYANKLAADNMKASIRDALSPIEERLNEEGGKVISYVHSSNSLSEGFSPETTREIRDILTHKIKMTQQL